ncbi:unnamed protein product [Notodromas monacha]|uniref:Uncharacterized protein n=1 Tax=Notodromas monacha TaxID=399045 RepID=A0A7R9GA30_9CRUS|nr:unnamed protein product [Notodromas monacha]CAG0913261.1 unnamed protein product [Notodromas monacha]
MYSDIGIIPQKLYGDSNVSGAMGGAGAGMASYSSAAGMSMNGMPSYSMEASYGRQSSSLTSNMLSGSTASGANMSPIGSMAAMNGNCMSPSMGSPYTSLAPSVNNMTSMASCMGSMGSMNNINSALSRCNVYRVSSKYLSVQTEVKINYKSRGKCSVQFPKLVACSSLSIS